MGGGAEGCLFSLPTSEIHLLRQSVPLLKFWGGPVSIPMKLQNYALYLVLLFDSPNYGLMQSLLLACWGRVLCPVLI